MRSFTRFLVVAVWSLLYVPSFGQSVKWNIDSMKQVLRTEKDQKEIAVTYSRIANALDENKPMEAVLYADTTISFGNKLNDTVTIINGYIAKGIALDNLGDYAGALTCQTTALALAQKRNEEFLVASCYTNIGMLYSHQGDQPQRVKEYYMKSMFIREKNHDRLLPSSYLNMSTAYVTEEKYDSARYYIQKCIDAVSDTTDPRLLAYAYNTMGSVYFTEKDYPNAILYFDKGRKLKEQNNDRKGMVSAYANIGEAYAMMKQYDKAAENLNIALAIAHSLRNKFLLREVYFTLSDVYKQQGDYRNAYEAFQMHTLYRDSIFNDQKAREILSLQEEHETQQKQRENELLKANNDIQAESIRRKDLLNYGMIVCLLLAVVGAVFIFRAYAQKKKANLEISRQKVELEVRNKEVFDSITYAKRIQYTLLANKELLLKYIPDHFVYFKPKDIVSGDFYWATTTSDGDFYLASCDSTGHGVPGAFMSLLNTSFLNEAVNEKDIREPGEVLNYVRMRLVNSVSKEGAQDGMDATLLRFSKGKITFAAANNNPVLVRNGKLEELPADKMAVGAGSDRSFTTHSMEIVPGDAVFIFTDGYADQFGGPKAKKFKYKQLYDLLESNAHLPLSQLSKLLSETHESWRGNLEQIDDICVIGFRI